MIRNLQYRYYSAADVRPTGWLKKQLRLQADGLAGQLDRLWPDVKDSLWIGGSRNDWERVPYWLDGFLPLAWLLDDEDMKARGRFYINSILARQQEDGWICPCAPGERGHYDTWAVLLLCKVLALYSELDKDTKAEEALYRALRQFNAHLDGTTLQNWGAARWFEGLIPIFWLYERRREDWLLLLAKKLNVQGFHWEAVFDSHMLDDLTGRWDYISHVVNVAMMLKSRSLLSRLICEDDPHAPGEAPDAFAIKAIAWLREHHGMACGHFTGDENLSGTSPIQGSELCSVVEAMYSFETLFSVSGNPRWLDDLEKEAFNALPAAFAPDMWSHQYVQLTNQVQCARLPGRVFRSNNEEAHIFGLEPHFGCCTANMGQGFPKLALTAFAATEDGIACPIPLPAEVTTRQKGVPVKVECISEYPFRTTVRYRITAERPVEFAFSIRVPAHVKNARLNGEAVEGGTFITREKCWQESEEWILTFDFVTRFEKRPGDMVCLWHGPLLFSLPLGERWEKREYTADGVERKFPHCDYYVYPTTPWNYGFAGVPGEVKEQAYDLPFTPGRPPLTLSLPMAPLPWDMPDGRCAPAPSSLDLTGEPQILTLIPYGCTNLRMTEMPYIPFGDTQSPFPPMEGFDR